MDDTLDFDCRPEIGLEHPTDDDVSGGTRNTAIVAIPGNLCVTDQRKQSLPSVN